MKKYVLLLTVTLVLVTVLAAQCGPTQANGPQILVTEPWARSSPMKAGNGAVYMMLENEGGTDDALIGAQTDVAEVVELHETKMDGDIMKMSPVSKIEVPADGSAQLKPGGLHVMLINLQQELIPGEKIELTLNFEKSDPLTVEADIRELGTGMDK